MSDRQIKFIHQHIHVEASSFDSIDPVQLNSQTKSHWSIDFFWKERQSTGNPAKMLTNRGVITMATTSKPMGCGVVSRFACNKTMAQLAM